MTNIYEYNVDNIDGENISLSQFTGKPLLIVNVASACGLTPHYKGLQSLFDEYKDKGLNVLGFPCNQFGAQEPGSHEEIKSFCETSFGVTFPLFAKIDVNGTNQHPLFSFLKEKIPGEEGNDIEWNFAKFLVDKNGIPVKRYHPKTDPDAIKSDIESIL